LAASIRRWRRTSIRLDRGKHPEEHLVSYAGLMQADAYAGFNRFLDDGRPCMSNNAWQDSPAIARGHRQAMPLPIPGQKLVDPDTKFICYFAAAFICNKLLDHHLSGRHFAGDDFEPWMEFID
jgi:hypothetical protein